MGNFPLVVVLRDKLLYNIFRRFRRWAKAGNPVDCARKPFKPRYPHTNSTDWSSDTSLRISEENLFKDQGIFLTVIILLILITFCLNDVLILLGENWCWSQLELEENYNLTLWTLEKILWCDHSVKVTFDISCLGLCVFQYFMKGNIFFSLILIFEVTLVIISEEGCRI